jgi:hypothetical protein
VSGSAKGERLDSSRNVTMCAICSPTISRTNKPKGRYPPVSASHRYNPKAGLALARVGSSRHFPGAVKTVVRKNVVIADLSIRLGQEVVFSSFLLLFLLRQLLAPLVLNLCPRLDLAKPAEEQRRHYDEINQSRYQ